MAKKNVVREDVVQVTFDIQDDELIKAQKEMTQFAKETDGGMREAVSDVKKGTDKIGKEFNELKGDMQSAKRQTGTLKTSFDKLNGSKIKQLPKKFTEIKSKIREARKQSEEMENSFDSLKDKAGSIAGALGVAVGAGALATNAVSQTKATNQVQASTGVSDKELKSIKKSMEDLYVGNMGEDWNDVANAISEVKNQTKLSGSELEKMTSEALLLRDTYDFDVKESVRSADMLMKQFGMSSSEAYNLIVQGAQAGLDKNGNLLDTMNEYSVHFKQIGFDAEDMMGMFDNAAKQGVFDIDKIGDAVKEFGIRAVDGSDSTAEGFKALGLDADKMAAKFKAGGETGKQAFYETLEALNAMEDPVAREAAGVQLFGTMWEDLGSKAVLAMSDTTNSIKGGTDALDKINQVKYDDALSALQSLGRSVNVWLATPINAIMPIVSKVFGFLKEHINGVMIALGVLGGLLLLGKAYMLGMTIATQGFTAVMAASRIGILLYNGVLAVWKGIMAAARVAQLLFNAALWANPITWIIIGIVALIAAVILLVKNWDIVKEKISAVWETLKAKAGAFRDAIVGKIKGIIDKIAGFKDAMLQKGKDLLQGFIDGIKSKFAALGKIGKGIKDKVMGALKWFKFGSPSKRMAQFGSWTIEGYANAIEDKANSVKSAMKDVVTNPFKDNSKVLVSGENDYVGTGAIASNTSTSESNTYNPQFYLTVSANGDRDMERKVKSVVKEAINEALESMSRIDGRLTEV